MVLIKSYVLPGLAIFARLASASDHASPSNTAPPSGIQYPDPTDTPYIDAAGLGKDYFLNEIDFTKAPDRHIHECEHAETGWSHHPWQTICSQPFTSIEEQKDFTAPSNSLLMSYLNMKRQDLIEQGGAYIVRSEIEPGVIETTEGWPEDAITWCNNPGSAIRSPKNGCELCGSINDNYIVPRGYVRQDGMHICVCKKWGKGSEQMQACNCDLCDAWIIQTGLRNECKKLRDTCDGKKYLSGYSVMANQNRYLRQYTDYKGFGKAHDYVVSQIQMNQTVCRSGVQGKKYDDHHGGMADVAPEGLEHCHQLKGSPIEGQDSAEQDPEEQMQEEQLPADKTQAEQS